jgi:hypothetical protein
MPPEGTGPGDPREWLRRARSNLARSSQGQVHALHQADALLTCDRGFYRRYFKNLKVIEP